MALGAGPLRRGRGPPSLRGRAGLRPSWAWPSPAGPIARPGVYGASSPQAEAEVRAALAATAADQLWVPAFEGGNPDHDGANAIASRLAAEGVSVLEFAEYNLAGGRARSHAFPEPGTARKNPANAHRRNPSARRQAPRAGALRLRARQPRLRRYRARDVPPAPRPRLRPPAARAGQLWYARFQWVPFRHPTSVVLHPAGRGLRRLISGLPRGQGPQTARRDP